MWYKDRVYKVPTHDLTSKEEALKLALQEEKLPIGIIYKNPRPTYEDELPQLKTGTMVSKGTEQNLDDVMPKFV